MGEATHDVRPAFGLAALARLLAANHPDARPGHQLGPRARIAIIGPPARPKLKIDPPALSSLLFLFLFKK